MERGQGVHGAEAEFAGLSEFKLARDQNRMNIPQIKTNSAGVWDEVPVRAFPLQKNIFTINFVPAGLEDCSRQDHTRTTVVVNRNSIFSTTSSTLAM
jgi:hypothetical protein